MKTFVSSKENISRYFSENLGFTNNPYYNYGKNGLKLDNFDEITAVHLISNTYGFKIWLIEIDSLKSDLLNKIANKIYNTNVLEYCLLLFTNTNYTDLIFVHYFKENKDKLKIRKLNIEDGKFTRTDLDIINSLSLINKSIEDDTEIELECRKAFDIEKVTKSFFDSFKNEIDYLTNNISGLDNNEHKRNYSVLLLSRMIFLYFIQKRKWLHGKKDFLYDRFLYCENNKLNYYKEILEPLFFDCLNTPMDYGIIQNRSTRAKKLLKNFESQTDIPCDSQYVGIPYLNGGLFEKHHLYETNTNIEIANSVFRRLFENLLEKYNFTVKEDIGYDSDIAVDPELLGRIFENMINAEERSTTGSFYTPRPIISHMCKKSLKEYLIRHLGSKLTLKINYLIDNVEDDDIYSKERIITINRETKKRETQDCSIYKCSKEEFEKILELIESVKICDPAVGSGAFILGMLQILLLITKKINIYLHKNITLDTYEIKNNIIQNNLYGVDIQEGATDIAHLRLWLSLAVEYNAPNIESIKPLPNLSYKIVQGNSLISRIGNLDLDEEIFKLKYQNQTKLAISNKEKLQEKFSDIISFKQKYFFATSEKQDLESSIHSTESEIIKSILLEFNSNISNIEINSHIMNKKTEYFSWGLNFPDIFVNKKDNDRGFDIIIGNPPYVSTKGVNKLSYKKALETSYGTIDDLYNFFTFKGIKLLKKDGVLAYITSNTFLTLSTKLNMRELLQSLEIKELILTPKSFDALVDTAIFVTLNNKNNQNYKLTVIDATNASIDDFFELHKSPSVDIYTTNINLYRNNLSKVFFIPNEINMQIYTKIIPSIKELSNTWWDKICTSKDISKNTSSLEKYRLTLTNKDMTLLGLITEGGVGLQTGNNGKFIGVISGSKLADNIIKTRPEKFYKNIIKDSNKKIKLSAIYPEINLIYTKSDVETFFSTISELKIRELFDICKEKFGRDIFGQGYLFRIISHNEIADIENMTSYEKLNGFSNTDKFYIPYDKGDKDGNRWYLNTPYYLDWSSEAVNFLITHSGKKGQGMPVVRNKYYYFKQGFCWSDVHTVYLKFRLKEKSIHDVKSMSLFNCLQESVVSEKYILAIMNSKLMSEFIHHFINNTSTCQINDSRRAPIIIPNEESLSKINSLVDSAIDIKKRLFNGDISESDSKESLFKIQCEIDDIVYEIYGINPHSSKIKFKPIDTNPNEIYSLN